MLGIIKLPIVPLRNSPNECSEMVSQLLFGEKVEILNTDKSWVQIRNLNDDYIGWADKKMIPLLSPIDEKIHEALHPVKISVPVAVVFKTDNSPLHLPLGSTLWLDDDNYCFLAGENFVYDAEQVSDIVMQTGKATVRLAKLFLNSPYLWGGKSVFGVDCSGLVQTVFSILGIQLKRDASQQALQGTEVESLENSKEGDVAFFANEAGKITHVGILLNEHQIIHASGYVKIEKIDSKGIISSQTKDYSHKLRSIRRMIE